MSNRRVIIAFVGFCLPTAFGVMHTFASESPPQNIATEKEDDDKDLRLEECPEPIAKTIKREATGGTIGKIEREGEFYEADVMIDGHEYELKIRKDGTLISKVLEEDEEDDKDDDQGDDE
jgi:hypothetical protein